MHHSSRCLPHIPTNRVTSRTKVHHKCSLATVKPQQQNRNFLGRSKLWVFQHIYEKMLCNCYCARITADRMCKALTVHTLWSRSGVMLALLADRKWFVIQMWARSVIALFGLVLVWYTLFRSVSTTTGLFAFWYTACGGRLCMNNLCQTESGPAKGSHSLQYLG